MAEDQSPSQHRDARPQARRPDRRRANELVHELQTLAVDDIIPAGPRAAEGFDVWRVRMLEPPSAMILESRRAPVTGRELELQTDETRSYLHITWAFKLAEMAPRKSRLHVRVRAHFHGSMWVAPIARAARVLFGPGDNVMEHTMLEGIRERAERRAAAKLHRKRS